MNSSVVTAGRFVVGLMFSVASITFSRSCSITSSAVGYILLYYCVQVPEIELHSNLMRCTSSLLLKIVKPSRFHFLKLFCLQISPVRAAQTAST